MKTTLNQNTNFRRSPCKLLLISLLSTIITACGGGGSGDSDSSGGSSIPTLQLSDGQVIDAGSGVIRIPLGDSSSVANVSAKLLRQGALPECAGRFSDIPATNTLIEACLSDQPTCAVDFIPGGQQIAVYPPPLYAPVGLEYQLSVVGRNGLVTDPVNTVFCLDVGINQPPQPAADTYQLMYSNVLQKAGVNFNERCEKVGSIDGVLANDDDDEHVTNTCLRAELLELPKFASNDGFRSTFGTDGGFRYEAFGDLPPPDSFGRNVDSFTYRVSDGINPPSAPVRVEIVFSSENAAPIAIDDSFNVLEDSNGNLLSVLDNDSDPDALPLSIRAINNGPGNGIANIRNGVLIDYQPVPNFSGVDQFVYTVVDSGGLTTTGTVSITVAAVNDPPEANNDSISTPENTSVEIFVLGNDIDPEGSSLFITQIAVPANGVAVNNGNGAILYTPNVNFSGNDPFEYTISDGNGGSSTATVVVSVDFVNVSPSGVNDNLTVAEDGSAVLNVLENDVDGDGDTLELLGVTEPQNGSVEITSTNSVRYTPNADFSGNDQFDYRISDGTVEVSASVLVTVSPVNDSPIAVDDSIGTSENIAITINVLDNDSDVDDDTLQIADLSQPANGAATIVNSAIAYTPDAGFTGVDALTYTISDGNGGSAVAQVSVQVSNVNVFPEVIDDSAAVSENTSVLIDVLANDSDEDGDPLAVSIVVEPENGVARVVGVQIEYQPATDFNGDDQFQYQVSDGQGGTAVATVRVAVNNVNAEPIATDDSASTKENEAVLIDVLANDSDSDQQDNLTIASATSPTNGIATITEGKISYRPNDGYNGIDTFQYTVSDGNGATDSASVEVSIASVNSDPVAVDDSATTSENTETSIAVLSNDSDLDGDSLKVELASQPSKGTASVSNNQIVYKPLVNQFGADSFTYKVSDGNGGSDIGNVLITINQVNNPPVAVDDQATTKEGEPVNVQVLGNDSDADNDDVLSVSIAKPANNGFADVVVGNIIRYTPDNGFSGTDSFDYNLSDGNGGSATATVTVSVSEVIPPNTAPVAQNDAFSIGFQTSELVNVLTNDSDADGSLDVTSVTVTSNPTKGTAVVQADGAVQYEHTDGTAGADSFSYTVGDDDGAVSNVATVSLTIGEQPNAAPIAVNDEATLDFQTSELIVVLGNDSDADGSLDVTSVTVTSDPTKGTAVVQADGAIQYEHTDGTAGVDSFSYTVGDDDGAVSNVATVSLTIGEQPNAAPVAVNDALSLDFQTSELVNVLTNDSDADGSLDVTSVTVTSNPTKGTAVVQADGAIQYEHTDGTAGVDSFSYTVGDDDGAVSNVATVSLTIGGQPNAAPVAVNDEATLDFQTSGLIVVLGNDSDADGTLDVTSVTVTSNPTKGTAVVQADGAVQYEHTDGTAGADSFSYTVGDDDGAVSNVATVSLTIGEQPNAAPVAVNDAFSIGFQTSEFINVLTNDSDADGSLDVTSVTVTSDPTKGTAVVQADGAIQYEHTDGTAGADSFSYTVGDDDGAVSNVATVSLTIGEQPNAAPVAVNDDATLDFQTSGLIVVLGNDSDADGTLDVTSVTVTSNPTKGTAVVQADGAVQYEHTDGTAGADSFSYTVGDDDGAVSNVATVSLTIGEQPNAAPIAVNDEATLDFQTSELIVVLGNDSDADGTLDVTSVTVTSDPTKGTAAVQADGTVQYEHTDGTAGVDSFSYTVGDDDGAVSNVATVSLTIGEQPNAAPVAVNDEATLDFQASMLISVLENDSDSDGTLDLSTVKVTIDPTKGTAVVLADGAIQYDHTDATTEADSFSYTVADNDGAISNVAEVSLTIIEQPNAPPFAENDAITLDFQSFELANVLGNDSDTDGTLDVSTVTVTSDPTKGTVVVQADGTIRYDHTDATTEADSFTYTVLDDDGALSNEATVAVTVQAQETQQEEAIEVAEAQL